jgi:adenylosuccinate lyase
MLLGAVVRRQRDRAGRAPAEAEEREGVIPTGVAAVIRARSVVPKTDWKLLAERVQIVSYPVLGLVERATS